MNGKRTTYFVNVVDIIKDVFFVVFSFAVAIVYFCPIRYVEGLYRPGEYLSVIKTIDTRFEWTIMMSFFFLFLCLVFSVLSIFSRYKGTCFVVFKYLVYFCAVVFAVLTFVFAFYYSPYYLK